MPVDEARCNAALVAGTAVSTGFPHDLIVVVEPSDEEKHDHETVHTPAP